MELLSDQSESNRQFRLWVKAMVKGSTEVANGWVIEGEGVAFNNYGHGAHGKVENQIMLGVDPSTRSGVVKIVQPDVLQRDLGKLTAIGRDRRGKHVLLRQGSLQKNGMSRRVQEDFAHLTGLRPVDVTVAGERSERTWFAVADLSTSGKTIVKQTAAFANACASARSKAGGGAEAKPELAGYRLGLDEKGRVKKVTVTGGTKEVVELQGYVWASLKKLVGKTLTKPSKGGYVVDGMIETARLLIEIKTGVSAQDVYGAVGQLHLYPSLVDLPPDLDKVLLVPDSPLMRPQMAAALASRDIGVFFYNVDDSGKRPKITFAMQFLDLCRRTK